MKRLIAILLVMTVSIRIWAADAYTYRLGDETLGHDGTVKVDRDASHNMTFVDQATPAGKTLTQLLAGTAALPALTVASSTSINKDSADHACDGTADEVQIQAAIDALTTGGVVWLLDGTFNLAASIQVKDEIQIIGAGIETTILVVTAANVRAFEIDPGTGITFDQIVIASLEIDCTGQAVSASGGGGIFNETDGTINELAIRDVKIATGASGNHGINFGGNGFYNRHWIENCYIRVVGTNAYGIRYYGGTDIFIGGNVLTMVDATSSGFSAIYIHDDAVGAMITRNQISHAGQSGISISTGEEVIIAHNDIDVTAVSSEYGIEVQWENTTGASPSEHVIIQGNYLHDGLNGIGLLRRDTGQPAPDHVIVYGNILESLTGTGIDASEVANLMVWGNMFDTVSTPYNDGTTSYDTFNVRGAFESKGAATLASASVTGTTNLNGAMTFGNGTGDAINVTGRWNSSSEPVSDSTYDWGSSSLKWSSIWMNVAESGTVDVESAAPNIEWIDSTGSAHDFQLALDANLFSLKHDAGSDGVYENTRVQIDSAGKVTVSQAFQADGAATLAAVTATNLDTGQGANELYAMDQAVQTTDDVTFKTGRVSHTAPDIELIDTTGSAQDYQILGDGNSFKIKQDAGSDGVYENTWLEFNSGGTGIFGSRIRAIADNSHDLGYTTFEWKDLYLGGFARIGSDLRDDTYSTTKISFGQDLTIAADADVLIPEQIVQTIDDETVAKQMMQNGTAEGDGHWEGPFQTEGTATGVAAWTTIASITLPARAGGEDIWLIKVLGTMIEASDNTYAAYEEFWVVTYDGSAYAVASEQNLATYETDAGDDIAITLTTNIVNVRFFKNGAGTARCIANVWMMSVGD